MKMLTWPDSSPAQEDNRSEHCRVEKQFHQRSGPARDASSIVRGEPGRVARASETAAMHQTPDASQHNADRSDERKPVARRAFVTEEPFGDFDACVAAEQSPKDGF